MSKPKPSVEAMFHGRLFRVTVDHWPAGMPRPLGDRRLLMLSAYKGKPPRIWLVPYGWESEGLVQAWVRPDGPADFVKPDHPGAVHATGWIGEVEYRIMMEDPDAPNAAA